MLHIPIGVFFYEVHTEYSIELFINWKKGMREREEERERQKKVNAKQNAQEFRYLPMYIRNKMPSFVRLFVRSIQFNAYLFLSNGTCQHFLKCMQGQNDYEE